MTLVAHAVARAPRPAVETRGLRDRPLVWSEIDGIGVWSTDWDSAMTFETADLMEHHRVVERLCAAETCLPMRFGTVFASDEGARAALLPRTAELREALERVAGKSELAVTLLWKEHPAPARTPAEGFGPGTQFMKERGAAYRVQEAERARAAELAGSLIAELAAEQPLVWHETCTTPHVAVSLAVLTPSERALERKRELEALVSRFVDVAGVVSGPWPPYSFARVR